jgi:hypothetical protein
MAAPGATAAAMIMALTSMPRPSARIVETPMSPAFRLD